MLEQIVSNLGGYRLKFKENDLVQPSSTLLTEAELCYTSKHSQGRFWSLEQTNKAEQNRENQQSHRSGIL